MASTTMAAAARAAAAKQRKPTAALRLLLAAVAASRAAAFTAHHIEGSSISMMRREAVEHEDEAAKAHGPHGGKRRMIGDEGLVEEASLAVDASQIWPGVPSMPSWRSSSSATASVSVGDSEHPSHASWKSRKACDGDWKLPKWTPTKAEVPEKAWRFFQAWTSWRSSAVMCGKESRFRQEDRAVRHRPVPFDCTLWRAAQQLAEADDFAERTGKRRSRCAYGKCSAFAEGVRSPKKASCAIVIKADGGGVEAALERIQKDRRSCKKLHKARRRKSVGIGYRAANPEAWVIIFRKDKNVNISDTCYHQG